MDDLKESTARKTLSDSIKSIHIADRILTMTYPLVKDEKLLVAVLDNTYLAASGAINAILENQRELKKIPPYHADLDSKMNVLRLKLCNELKINPKDIVFIEELKELVKAQKTSKIEFNRPDKRVFFDGNEVHSLSKIILEKHIEKTKNLISISERVLSEN